MLLRSLLAIGAGFGVIAALVAVTTLLKRWLIPSWTEARPSAGARFFNLAASCLYCAMGGRVVARLAPVSPLVHALVLAIIVLLLSTLAAKDLQTAGPTHAEADRTSPVPAGYSLALAVLPSLATLGAGILTVLGR